MLHDLIEKFDRRIGLRHETQRERVLLVEILAAFVPRMPLIYIIMLVNLGGLLIAVQGQVPFLFGAGAAIFLLLAARLTHWLRLPSQPLSEGRALKELRRVFLLGVVITTSYCA